jgi:hypothetical protein
MVSMILNDVIFDRLPFVTTLRARLDVDVVHVVSSRLQPGRR